MDKDNERIWSVFAHLGFVIGMIIPFGTILTPAFVLFINKGQSRLVTANAREALNFQVYATGLVIVFALLALVFGLLLENHPGLYGTIFGIGGIALAVWYVYHCVKGLVKANDEGIYQYPTPFDLFRKKKEQELHGRAL